MLACGSRRPQRAGDATATIPQCRRRSVGLFHDLRLRCPARHESMTHVWNERYWALSAHTYRVLYDAGINEKLADELATHRTLAVALKPRGRPFPDFAAAASDYFDPARFTDRTRKLFVPRVRRHPPRSLGGWVRPDVFYSSDFSHPISHRTPHYRVGNGAIERSAASQESHIFRDKTELQDTGQDGLQRFRKPLPNPI